MQLTGTNRSMTRLSAAFSGKYQKNITRGGDASRPEDTIGRASHARFSPRRGPKTKRGGLAGLVAIARGKTPDPIPNSAVKTLSADGTAS